MVQPVEKENYEYYELRESVVTLQPGFKFQKLKNFVSKGCSDGSFPFNDGAQLSVGESDVELPEAAFDEVIIWYRNLASDEISAAYSYYKGNRLNIVTLTLVKYSQI